MTNKINTKTTQKRTRGTPSDIDIHVGKRLKIRRNLMGLSQDELAKEIGITFQQIQKYEHGTNRISAGKLFEFAKALNVHINFFFEGLPNAYDSNPFVVSDNEQEGFLGDNNNSPTNDWLENKETIELVRCYYAIEDEKVRTRLLQFIKSVGESAQKGDVAF